jgi:hypothetical protein
MTHRVTSFFRPEMPEKSDATRFSRRYFHCLSTLAGILDLIASPSARISDKAGNDSKLGRAQKISRQLRHIAAPSLGANLE